MSIVALLSTTTLPIAKWQQEIPDVPSGHQPTAPILGNGYVGYMMGTRCQTAHAFGLNQSSINATTLFINSNSNWECHPAKTTAPPANCAMRALGSLTIAVPSWAAKNTSFAAEQRLADGRLWSRRRLLEGGAAIETLTYMHPVDNVAVTEVSLKAGAGATSTLDVDVLLWIYGANHHTPPSTQAECVITAHPITGDGAVTSCSRRHGPLPSPTVRTMWTAIAVHANGAKPISARVNNTSPAQSYGLSTYTLTSGGKPLTLITTLSDNLITDTDIDPKPTATALAASAKPSTISTAATAQWSAFWKQSMVSLPTRHDIENLWIGAQYALAISTPNEPVYKKWNGRAPPPGLYGPFATGDFDFWNGDYTLDYNYQATFFGTFGSNHPELSSAYFAPITDWMDAARVLAQQRAKKANLTCSADALLYAAHLAPWGYQSLDTSVYGTWNGPFAALLFINHWEYTRDKSFAKQTTLPLLQGMSSFAHCFLYRNTSTGHLVLDDWNKAVPDQVFENTPATNPLTGTSLILRVATAQIDISIALNMSYPKWLDEIVEDLAPFATDRYEYAQGAYADLYVQSDGVNVADMFERFAHFSSVLFPLYPSEAVSALWLKDKKTRGIASATARFYTFGFNCTPPRNSTPAPHSKWVGGVPSGWGGLALFSSAARAIGGQHDGYAGTYSLTATELLNGLDGYIDAYRLGPGDPAPNLLLYAPGGGVENAGLSQAVNDMLLQSLAVSHVKGFTSHIMLFPAWPREEPAAFTSLRAKGAVLITARWNHTAQEVQALSFTATVDVSCKLSAPAMRPVLRLACESSAGARSTRAVRADASETDVWRMAEGEVCRQVE